MTKRNISLVIPAYNEQEGIIHFHQQVLKPEIKKIKDARVNIIYVNDGSSDNTLSILQDIANADKLVSVLNLSRNFGKEIATTAGIFYAKGDAIICLDADGQHPPARLSEFINKWQNGADVVVGVRNSNVKEGFVKKVGSILFYKLFNRYSGSKQKIIPGSTDYRLIDRQVQSEFIKFTERQRITRGLIDWLGFKRDYVHFDSPERIAGTASYRTKDLAKLAANSFISLSIRPLLISGYIGSVIFSLSMIAGIFVIVEQYILGDPMQLRITGSAQLSIFISCLVGILLISQSMISIYISHIHTQTQARPLFVIDKSRSINI